MAWKYKLIHELGNTIHTGTKQECEIVLKGLTTYGIRDDKFSIEEFETEKFLSDTTREHIVNYLLGIELGAAFGDGQEEEMVLNGAKLPGLYNLSDDDLLEMLETYSDCDDDKSLLAEALAQKATYDMLKDKAK